MTHYCGEEQQLSSRVITREGRDTMENFVTYILQSKTTQRYYIGYTSNLTQRLTKHNNRGSRWTKYGIPWIIVYTKMFTTKREAIQHEHLLKKLENRNFLEQMIAGRSNSCSQGS